MFGVNSSMQRRGAIFALVCVAALGAGCGRPEPAARNPEAAANTFFAALEKGDARSAYDGAAFAFQAGQTFEAFSSNARELGLVGGKPPAWTRRDFQATEARLDGTVTTQTGTPLQVSITLTPEGGAWKLFTLRTSTPDEHWEPEDRFTMVGKGVGFNDVYHQPMPSQKDLALLVHETMGEFNTAIQSGDFHAFYRSISQQWRQGYRTNGETVAGVTEKMIKDHFQGFIDDKIDLSVVQGLPPVFDRLPLINQDGLLVLDGHFNTPQFRADFHMEYTYELPRWKLFGIDLSLSK